MGDSEWVPTWNGRLDGLISGWLIGRMGERRNYIRPGVCEYVDC